MMPFNWSHLLTQARRSTVGTRGTHRRLTAHRAVVLAIFWLLFVPHQIATRICLMLDNIFFPGWKKIPVERPLFITGLFRSGTTFLHRLLAEDANTFSAFKTWEIYLAPSITQRKILKAWKAADRVFGAPAMTWLNRYNTRRLGEIRFHQVGLWKEEEDEGLLLYLWDSLFTWFFFPDTAGVRDFAFADREMSPGRQKRKFKFYKTCIQRHLACHPGAPVYLSKNPAFTPKLASLKEAFPDARIVYLVRDPAEVLVSQAAWFSFCWHYFASPAEAYPFRDFLLEMTKHWYRYPLSLMDRWPDRDYLIIEYRNLVSRPVETISRLYEHFNLIMDGGFRTRLAAKSEQTGEYPGGRNLSPEEIGYDMRTIQDNFAEVYRRFDFSD